MIPPDVMELIRKRFPSLDFQTPVRWSRAVGEDQVREIGRRISEDCEVEFHYTREGDYSVCHTLDFSTARDRRPARGVHTLEGPDPFPGEVMGTMQISQLGPIAALSWYVLRDIWYQSRACPSPDLANLEACVRKVLENAQIRILPWELLTAEVPGMTGRALGNVAPTVYNCLFSEI